MSEVVRGGNPASRPAEEGNKKGLWKFTLLPELRRDLKRRQVLLESAIKAITEVCESPMAIQGNTVKPLQGELRGMWRYRIGDFRLIYEPDPEAEVVHFLALKPRSSSYE